MPNSAFKYYGYLALLLIFSVNVLALAQSEYIIHDSANNILAIHNDKSIAEEQSKNAQIQSNRLQFQGDTHYQYDVQGCTSVAGAWSAGATDIFGNRTKAARGREQQLATHFEYDSQHRLCQVESTNGTSTFKYDALGRRIEKNHTHNGQTRTTNYLWQGDQLLDEKTETNGQIANQQNYLFKPNSFEALALVKDEKVYSYHLDHLGTPEALTDEKGDIVWYVGYSSYGKIAVNHQSDVLKLYRHKHGEDQNLPKISQPLRFQGQYFDEETNLHYNRHRYYDPNSASFITQDPIKLAGGINNYRHVLNPITWIDPLGLSCKETSIARINHYEPDSNNPYGHYSIEMITNDKELHTHQVITSPDKSSTTIVSATEYPPSNPLKKSIDIEVPSADKGIEYQESKIWEELGPYNEKRNSCIDHVCEALRQSGADIKKSPLRQYKYLKDLGF